MCGTMTFIINLGFRSCIKGVVYTAYYLTRPDSLLPQGHLLMFQKAAPQGQTGLEVELYRA